jgi:hypothetical protein
VSQRGGRLVPVAAQVLALSLLKQFIPGFSSAQHCKSLLLRIMKRSDFSLSLKSKYHSFPL